MPCNHILVVLGWPWFSLEDESKLASKLLSMSTIHIPQVLGDSALEEGSGPRYLLDIMSCWHIARGQPIMWERTCYITNGNAWNALTYLGWGNIVLKFCFVRKNILSQLIHF